MTLQPGDIYCLTRGQLEQLVDRAIQRYELMCDYSKDIHMARSYAILEQVEALDAERQAYADGSLANYALQTPPQASLQLMRKQLGEFG